MFFMYTIGMRRFVLTMIILLLLGAAVFFVGWLPLRVKPGSYAVLVSKSGGVSELVVEPGVFRWSPLVFLPTNVRFVYFSPVIAERLLELTGELPSAELYGAFMAGEPDFSYAISARLSAAAKPESLPELFKRWGVDDDEKLSAWLASEMDLAANELKALLARSHGDADRLDEASLALAMSAGHPLLDIRGVRIVSVRQPDPELYDEARRLYASYMDSFKAAVEPAMTEASIVAAQEQIRMDTLKRYGQLLEQHPVLIDYLAIEAGLAPRAIGGK